jgi:hypothetical protein
MKLSTYKAWIEEAALLRNAFFLTVRMIHPKLPKWFVRIAALKDVGVIAADDFGEMCVHGMHPLDILRVKGVKVFFRWLRAPLLRWANTVTGTVVMYRWLKRYRASKAASE